MQIGRDPGVRLMAEECEAPPRPRRRSPASPGTREVRRHLERVLASPDFDSSRRSQEFLRFVVDETLAGRAEAITQPLIATRVFGRKDDFDPAIDPIVRIQAGRLRRSLERYYLLAGRQDPVRIELPKGGYIPTFRNIGLPQPDAAGHPSPLAGPPDDWPSIELTRFEIRPGDADLESAAADTSTELAMEMSRYETARIFRQRDLDTAPPELRKGVRFALGGRLRRENEGLRVTAWLVDRATGRLVWEDRYDTVARPSDWTASLEGIPRVIAARVAAEEGVLVHLLARERRRQAGASSPYAAVLKACEFFLARKVDALPRVEAALRKAVDTDPDCALAWMYLARVQLADHAFEVTPQPPPIDQALSSAHTAVRLDPTKRRARCVLAAALLVKGELDEARAELDEALRYGRDSLVYLEIIGFLLTALGDWERGPALCREARARNPHHLPQASFGLWLDGLHRRDLPASHQAAMTYRDSTFFWRALMRASSLGLLGRVDEARVEAAEILRVKPDFETRGRILVGRYVKSPDVAALVADGLARAGLKLA